MKRILLLIAFVVSCVSINAQDSQFEQARKDYQSATQEERKKMDEFFQPLEEKWHIQQVKTIGGVPFGITHEKAEKMLENKFGRAAYNPSSTTLTYNKVKYAGYDFDAIHFLFQSDGLKSYLNGCVFIINTKDLQDAVEKEKYVAEKLLSKYQLFEDRDNNGNITHGGGISPLWDGKWNTLDVEKYGVAIHTDILIYNKELVELYEFPYAVRIIYGPYNYIQEEF